MTLKNALVSAAGNAAENAYIEDVFSTYLYTGNGGTQTITNGIDLAGEGGMIWLKSRSSTTNPVYNHRIYDTARGVGAGTDYALSSNLTDAQANLSVISSVNSDGWTFGGSNPSAGNNNGDTYASWTFRKAPKFFDVVTYTGNGVAGRTVAHNLGAEPGCMIIKKTSSTGNWPVYHRFATGNGETGNSGYLQLNTTIALTGGSAYWNNTHPTATVFTIGNATDVNQNGATYVAYLFAHDAGGFGADGTDNVISCGSFTTDGSGNATVSLGYEPQWLLTKKSAEVGDWTIWDVMRGFSNAAASNEARLYPNTSDAETLGSNDNWPTATGFQFGSSSNATFIYIAIRRGPMKVPESGTSVFSPQVYSGDGTNNRAFTTGFVSDMVWWKSRSNGTDWGDATMLIGINRGLTLNQTSGEGSATGYYINTYNNTGFTYGTSDVQYNGSGRTYVLEAFSRAPGFFDVVAYTGTGVANRTVNHNLGVAPELMIVKNRTSVQNWAVYNAASGATKYLYLQSTAAVATSINFWNNTAPTSTIFTVDGIGGQAATNASGSNYVAYLFATLAGVSKVGSYTGTGTTNQIDCGFSSGARFVLIKRTDSTGDWYVWDSARGIVAGNDPYLLLNSTAVEVTNTDYVDTYSAGFELSSTAPAAINANGGSYIFLAIA